jgi:hypothetical protein
MCSLAFAKLGFPAAFMMFKQDFLMIILVSCAGGIAGNIAFTYLSAAAIKWRHNYRVKKHSIHSKKIFTKFNRRVITVKNRFGLTGIALITPLLLSTPLGAFLADRFFKNKKKVIIYLSVSTIFWSLALYVIFIFFYDSLKGWLI